MSSGESDRFLPVAKRWGGGPAAGWWKGRPETHSASAAGFTLIEMLVALAIFSLAALALLRLAGATAGNSARLNEQAMAQIVAHNIAVDTLSAPGPPPFGVENGRAINGNREWLWTRNVARSPEPRIQQIEIQVTAAQGGPGRAALIVFRRSGA